MWPSGARKKTSCRLIADGKFWQNAGIFLSKVQLKRNWQQEEQQLRQLRSLSFCRCFCSQTEKEIRVYIEGNKKRKSRCRLKCVDGHLMKPSSAALRVLTLLIFVCILYSYAAIENVKIKPCTASHFAIFHSHPQQPRAERIHFQIFCSRNFHEVDNLLSLSLSVWRSAIVSK